MLWKTQQQRQTTSNNNKRERQKKERQRKKNIQNPRAIVVWFGNQIRAPTYHNLLIVALYVLRGPSCDLHEASSITYIYHGGHLCYLSSTMYTFKSALFIHVGDIHTHTLVCICHPQPATVLVFLLPLPFSPFYFPYLYSIFNLFLLVSLCAIEF